MNPIPQTTQSPINDRLFVYGTLMQEASNSYAAHLHTHSTFIGRGHFTGRLFRVGWYPGAVHDPAATGHVLGEVYQLRQPAATLVLLDEYEDTAGESGEFIRAIVPVTVLGQNVDCWVYLYNHPTVNLVQVESGDFRPFL